jgi:hypothetical protein
MQEGIHLIVHWFNIVNLSIYSCIFSYFLVFILLIILLLLLLISLAKKKVGCILLARWVLQLNTLRLSDRKLVISFFFLNIWYYNYKI